jgi:hypothetical protein
MSLDAVLFEGWPTVVLDVVDDRGEFAVERWRSSWTP